MLPVKRFKYPNANVGVERCAKPSKPKQIPTWLRTLWYNRMSFYTQFRFKRKVFPDMKLIGGSS